MPELWQKCERGSVDRLLSDEKDERSLLDNLFQDSRLYKTSEDYMDLFQFIGRIWNFAPFNALLLQIQKPGMRFAASKMDWWDRFGAQVKEDARPLLILWPFSPVALVYDVVDVTGGTIPVDAESFVAKGAITEGSIAKFLKRMEAADIFTDITDSGGGKAGSIRMTTPPKDEKSKGWHRMKLNRNHEPPVRFVTINSTCQTRCTFLPCPG
jgi:hypothetical protein